MNRRELIVLLGAAAVPGSFKVLAQQKAVPVVGFLSAASPIPTATRTPLAGFQDGLNNTGFIEGKNVAIQYRWAEGRFDRLPALAADLVARNVEVIVAAAGDPPALAAKRATSTIPIVFTSVTDPVKAGLVTSFARPGGNLTGFAFQVVPLGPKRLEFVSEMVGQSRSFALLVNPNQQYAERQTQEAQEAAHARGMELLVLEARSESEIGAAFAALVRQHAGALVVASDPFFTSRLEQLVALAAHYAVPAIYYLRRFVASGGLISYGPSFPDMYRGAGVYVGRILKGERPGDLPVQQPTKFELVINLKTAGALGLAVPPSILARADEVIE